MPRLIIRYDLRWNANTNAGAIFLQLQGGQSQQVPIQTAEEFIAVSSILSRSPVFLLPDGTIEYKTA